MKRKIILGLLIQCGILFQAFESLSDTNSTASWRRHIRKKRIIDTTPNRNETFLNQDVRYVVLIVKENGEIKCTGAILAPRIIISAAHCVKNNRYSVESGGHRSELAKVHKILIKHVHENFDADLKKHDIALLVIVEPIDVIHSYHRAIELYEGSLPPNRQGLITGWGSIHTREPFSFPSKAQSIRVNILSLQECQRAYSNNPEVTITFQQICTYYINRTRRCWFGDSGAPLVVDGHLVGIFSWFQPNSDPDYPDIFMNLLYPDYKLWIQGWVSHFRRNYPN